MPTDANGKYFEVGCLTPQQYYAWDDKPEEFVFEPLTDNAKACVEVNEAKQTGNNRINGFHPESAETGNPVDTTPLKPDENEVSSTSTGVDVPKFTPFPTYALHGSAGELVKETAASLGCDESMVAVPVLACMASAIGRSRYLVAKSGWNVPSVIWTGIVAESGSLKTPAIRQALSPLKKSAEEAREEGERLLEQYEIELSKYESEYSDWKKRKGKDKGEPPLKPSPPQIRRLVVSDATVEAIATILQDNPRGFLVERDELASWFGSFDAYKSGKGADAGCWLSMHSAEGFTIDRKTGQRNIHVRAGAVSIVGGIQPKILRQHLRGQNSQNGLSARLLMVSPPSSPKSWSDDEISQGTVDAYEDLIRSLLSLSMTEGEYGPEPLLLGMSSDAKKLYREWYNSHNEEAFQYSGELRAAYAKIEELPLRLSLILHCCYHDDKTPVSGDTMEAAIELSQWFRSEALRVRAIMEQGKRDDDMERLLDWIDSNGGGVTARDVQRGCRWIKTSDDAEKALKKLVDAGKGRWETSDPGPLGGRPTRIFRKGVFQAPNRVDVDTTSKLSGNSEVSSTA